MVISHGLRVFRPGGSLEISRWRPPPVVNKPVFAPAGGSIPLAALGLCVQFLEVQRMFS